MNKKTLFIFIIVVLIIGYLNIKKDKLTVDVENPLACYINAFPNTRKINECSASLLEKEIERIKDFKVN